MVAEGALSEALLPRNGVSLLGQVRVVGHDDRRAAADERTQTLAPLQADYWEAPLGLEASIGTDSGPPERRGLTGATRLLEDIEKLDLYAFETDERKRQITKPISVSSFAPAEFQRFRTTGVLRFDTPMAIAISRPILGCARPVVPGLGGVPLAGDTPVAHAKPLAR